MRPARAPHCGKLGDATPDAVTPGRVEAAPCAICPGGGVGHLQAAHDGRVAWVASWGADIAAGALRVETAAIVASAAIHGFAARARHASITSDAPSRIRVGVCAGVARAAPATSRPDRQGMDGLAAWRAHSETGSATRGVHPFGPLGRFSCSLSEKEI